MKKFVLLFFVMTFPVLSYGIEINGSIENSMGGASLAVSSINGSLFTNPSLYSFNYIYSVELLGFLSPSKRYGGRISIIDTVSSPVSGGMSFSYSEKKNGGPVKMNFLFNLARAYKFIAGGVNFKYYMRRKTWNDNAFLMDLGIGAQLYRDIIKIGVVAENLLQYGLRDPEVERGYGVGIGGSAINRVVWDFDYLRRGNSNIYRGGIEFLFLKAAIGISGGYNYSDNGTEWFGTGIHIYGPKLVLSYSFSRDLNAKDNYHILSLIFIPRR